MDKLDKTQIGSNNLLLYQNMRVEGGGSDGDFQHRHHRERTQPMLSQLFAIALTLLAASAVVAAPVITDLVQRTANRPSSDRGSRRRLEGIRNNAPESELTEFFVDSPNAFLP